MPQTKKAEKKFSWREIFHFTKDYFVNSDEKLKAWLLLLGIIVCVLAIVGLTAALSWWSAGFWALLTAKALTPFLISIAHFALLVCGMVASYYLKNHLMGKLTTSWRKWLSNKLLEQILRKDKETNYLDLKRLKTIDNVGQRIQEDVHHFVELALNLGVDFFQSMLTLGTFIGTLWVIGGSLAFTVLGLHLVIPGYLVWLALLIAAGASAISHYIGKSFATVNQESEKTEADFRRDLILLNKGAENVAQEHAEAYHHHGLKKQLDNITTLSEQKVAIRSKLVAFQNFYLNLSNILPILLAAPAYFAGLIDIGQLMQVGISFAQVGMSLDWFVNSYERIASCNSSMGRLMELEQTCERGSSLMSPKSIIYKETNKNYIKIKDLSLTTPTSPEKCILRNLNLTLTPGEAILFEGNSGLGKSTVFKAIAKIWLHGMGTVSVPADKRILFLPQTPTLGDDTLAAVLAYPCHVGQYSKAEYEFALEEVGLTHLGPELYVKEDWSERLSGGEQQRIAVARAFLQKPDWLFMDESTAHVDEETETRIYTRLKQLKNTTIVSIAHRRTLEKVSLKDIIF